MGIKRVFVANRGEIAVRIIRACRRLGLEVVVGASEVDRGGLAARMADRAVCIGPGAPARSYLNVGAVVQAALGTGCDAIHPGYGFLSENPALASAAREHGLRFIGPPAGVIELAGDKLRSRETAAAAGLPVVPGGEVRALEDALRFAEAHGYPVLLKAAAGGGGRGIKLAWDRGQLERLFGVALAEAGAAFGDDRLYVERFIRRARHVEVQVAADEHGGVVHFGERDCSVQRRYQKIVEEAPAPALDPGTRAALHAAAVRFAAEIGYRNLGTVEFVVDARSGEFFFLEMNCRIQVEHPVTEAITGRDLVADQIRIAAGEPLEVTQEEVGFEGHAIECRLTAEDAAHGFRPTPGRITRFSVPNLPGLRVDTHCEEGTLVPPYYDSLIAKLITFANDRSEAAERMREALAGLRVEGVPTNRDLLSHIIAHPDFAGAAVSTGWLEEAVLAA
ncbi:Carbamoyl-phosphate synthase L chain, ATP-binding protein [Rubrobacter xylanophilus DSM 9941]|uniref:biotin carboxylase n=1 Tax=Rubrobacter xylanophilus (strain DSM 9941 / JCM 11954 / NBRC 16129 / PRD-1) TaxID=266117 RepID=Q1AVP4_RUBXD|nr:biotin carboxylase N-terminal domain-containing protein [Rubrobacter xylanophilus]ABG04534.1 Carbamoyl-phosphate synthase L chain, ATP-binding protein [Rubrobacter xylanophilus DSM 9941]